MEINSFIWLQNWYESQWDGDWEHTYGIEIKTLDNPGWLIIVDLLETELEDYDFQEISVKRSDNEIAGRVFEDEYELILAVIAAILCSKYSSR